MNSFLETVKQLGPARLGIMGGLVLTLMIFFLFISMRASAPNYSLLYSDLSSVDSGSVAAKLEELQIAYRISEDGARITVEDSEVGRARMILAEAGLPNGGTMGYELFDKSSGFGMTNDLVNLNKVRALEGEIARTIRSLDPISSARVLIVLPERELFSRQSRPASASVTLDVRSGARLHNDQVMAIQSLVASAVPQLKPEKVSVIDQTGKLLARGDESSENIASMKADEARLKHEIRLIRTIEDLVGRIVGYGNVSARLNVDLNFDQISTSEEIYDPESQVARSLQTLEENNVERNADERNVSVENNLPAVGNDLFFDAAPSLESNRLEETTNFEISKTTRNVVRETGTVRKLSVAVLVNGTYVKDAEGNEVYTPRTEKELDQIAALVRSAIGYDASRGDELEVINMQFSVADLSGVAETNTIFGFDRDVVMQTAGTFALALAFILFILLVIQPMIKKLLDTGEGKLSEEEEELERALLAGGGAVPGIEGPNGEFIPTPLEDDEDNEGMINMDSVQGKVKASSVKKVEDIIEDYPNETVSVIRSWMTED